MRCCEKISMYLRQSTEISGDSNDRMFGWNILICSLFFFSKSSLFFLRFVTKKTFFYEL